MKQEIDGWSLSRILPGEIDKYLNEGEHFIPVLKINEILQNAKSPDDRQLEDIIDKAQSIETLSPEETAMLLKVNDPEQLAQMKEAALKIKKTVYDNRIVTFAPLYTGTKCVNDCLYCGFQKKNQTMPRKVLTFDEIRQEVKILAGKIGHKRLITVYGEHPETDIDYMCESIRTIYSVKEPKRKGYGQIRRVNVNAPPLSVEELKQLVDAGIGTYQVFQETYHPETYKKVHPQNSIKGNYLWRIFCMHRAFEAGIDDVGIGALFGLYDWQFEVMGLLHHSIELEKVFGIGPHTISFPRMEPAVGAPYSEKSPFRVSDDDFKKALLVIRLSVPYTGMILTARESADIRRELIDYGVTQTDASTKIALGAYSHEEKGQKSEQQQFTLGDTRTLDELIRELTGKGYITSFCTAGYRCGRTGKCIMDLLRTGQEGKFCKLNAVITFREWLDDFATPETQEAGEILLQKEMNEVKNQMPSIYPKFSEIYEKTCQGERDLFF